MRTRFVTRTAQLVGVATSFALVSPAGAQDTATVQGPFEYAAKFVCGVPPSERAPVAPGTYFTAINVHNPGSAIRFRFKIAFTAPTGPLGGPITGFATVGLEADRALEIDCERIMPQTRLRFAKGFVVIQSDAELDVVAVYTAAGPQVVTTMDVERVTGRPVIRR